LKSWSIAARRGVTVLDGRDALEAGGLDVEAALLDLMHPTGAANALMAEALADSLVAAGWPGERLAPDDGPPLFAEHLADEALVDDLAGAQGPILDRAPVGAYRETPPEVAFKPGVVPPDE